MSILARKTTISKWQKAVNFCQNNVEKLPADVITSDLKTFNNTLSTWKINFNEKDEILIDDVVIALLTGPKVEHIETIDLIFIDTDRYNQFEYKNTDGDTLVESLKKRHYDVCNLNLKTLGEFCIIYLDAINGINANSNEKLMVKKISKAEVIKIIRKALKEKRVSLNNFSEKMQDKVKKIMEKVS